MTGYSNRIDDDLERRETDDLELCRLSRRPEGGPNLV